MVDGDGDGDGDDTVPSSSASAMIGDPSYPIHPTALWKWSFFAVPKDVGLVDPID